MAAVAAGELPASAAQVPAAGTWRPAPPGVGGGPGSYATSLPLLLAHATGQEARVVAARLAAALEPVPWIAGAGASGPGYLTVAVTASHLAALPARIVATGQQPGPAVPPVPEPAAAPDWPRAWTTQRDALAGRLAVAAGQDDRQVPHEDGPRDAVAAGPVAGAVAWYGADAVRYVLARTARPRSAAIERQLGLRLDLDNPFVLVRYAHAHAASTTRWAADLARAARSAASARRSAARAGRTADEPRPELQPAELALIGSLSWCEERLAAAARRRRPAELCAYLERVAATYLHCAQDCPALPCGGAAAPPDPSSPQATARLELAAAARFVLARGLRLAGVSSPVQLFGL